MNVGGIVSLTLIWVMATSNLHWANLLLGVGVAVCALAVSGHLRMAPVQPGRLLLVQRARAWVVLGFVFLFELVSANLMVAGHVIRPRMRLRPGILVYPLRLRDDVAIALFLSLITLTPGIVVLGVSRDKSRYYVHAIDARDLEAVRKSVERLEQRVLELCA